MATPSGEDFWWLNNGITLLTDEAILATNKELVLTEPAVVNGLQTSNEIYRFFQENPEKLANETRNILVRVIVPESEDSRDRIILATNNQTNIPKSSLRANDPIHWQIELFLKGRGLYYDRRKNYYKNQGKKSNEIVSVSFLAQCMISLLLQKPNYARARPSTLLTKDETYNELYLNNPNLDVFYNAAKLGKTIDIYLKKSNQYTPSQKNDIVFYVLYYAVAKAINKSTITLDDVKNINLNFFSEKYILEAAQEVFEVYNSLGGNGRIAKGTEMLTAILARIPEKAENSHALADLTFDALFGTYIDRALSAKTDNRPEFQRMIKDSYRKLFDTVLVWKLDRFARNRYDSAYYKNILKKNGVKVISAKENISDGPEGVLLESMLEGFKRSNGHNISNLRTKQPIQCKVKAIGDNIRWLLS